MGIKAYPPHHEQVFQGLFAVDVAHCPTRKEAEERLSKHISDESTLQFLLKNLYWKEQGVLDWRFNLEVPYKERFGILSALSEERIEASTLFLTGGKSLYVLNEDHDSIRRVAVNAQFECMPNSGHWLHAEAPEEFIRRCMTYFTS
jgi:pimeloyl-ACP methyl ester carboxylesterase